MLCLQGFDSLNHKYGNYPTLFFYPIIVFVWVAKTIKTMKKILLMGGFLASFLMSFAQVPSYVPTDGLAGYWPFNGNANDESGNGNDLSAVALVYSTDRFGNANSTGNFDGVSSYASKLNEPSLYPSSFTLSTWINTNIIQVGGNLSPTSQTIAGYLPSDWSLGAVYKQWLFTNDNSNLVSRIWTAQNPNQDLMTGVGYVSTDVWYNVTNSFDATTQIHSLYVNGALIQSNSGQMQFSGQLGFFVGATRESGNGALTDFFSGKIDDIGFWNRALTQEEIQALFVGCNVLPTTIVGNVSPVTLASADYSYNNNPGSTYQWTVTNGVITAGQGTSTVTVLWGEEGVGTLTVTETNGDGCSGAPVTINVDVICSTTATLIDGPLGPNALTSTNYTCNGSSTSTYQWTISNGVITSGQGTNTVTVLWAGTGLGTISVQETTTANCQSDVISIDVVVIPTGVEEQENAMLVFYPNPASQFFTMEFGSSYIAAGYSIQILNTIGQNVLSKKVMNNREVIDVSTWPAGNYLISVLNDKGTEVETKTIVIQ